MKIITGRTGTAHVTSSDDRALNNSIWGESGILCSDGFKLIDSNTVRVMPLELMFQGCHARILPGEYEDLNIDSGTSGYKRIDLIVARYRIDSEGIESMELKVIKGEAVAASETPNVPAYIIGRIGVDTVADMPLIIIRIDGFFVSEPEVAVKTLVPLSDKLSKGEVFTIEELNPILNGMNEGIEYARTVAMHSEVKAGEASEKADSAATTAENAYQMATSASSEAANALSMAKDNAAEIKNVAKVANNGRVILKSWRKSFDFEASVGSTASTRFDVPPGTNGVFGIVKNISSAGVNYQGYDYSLADNMCDFEVSAFNQSSEQASIVMLIIAIGPASQLS